MIGLNIFGGGFNPNKQGERGPPGIGFKYLDEHKNYDINSKRLANVSDPVENKDAANKLYVDNYVEEIKNKYSELTDKHDQLNSHYLNIVSAVTEQSEAIAENENKIEDGLSKFQDKLITTQEEIHQEFNSRITDQEAELKHTVVDELELLNQSTNEKLEKFVLIDQFRGMEAIVDMRFDDVVTKRELEDKNFVTDAKLKSVNDEWNRINNQIVDKKLIEGFSRYNADVEKITKKYVQEHVNPELSELRDNIGIVQDFSMDIAINSNEIENIKILVDELREKLDKL